MLILTGTHCSPQTGNTGLTDPSLLEYKFYEEDCRSVGVEPRDKDDLQPLTKKEKKTDTDGVEPRQPEDLQPLSKKLKKMDLLADEDMKDMDIRLANMAYYQGKKKDKKLLRDIDQVHIFFLRCTIFRKNIIILFQFKPDFILLSFCRSINSDVTMLLRRSATLSEMVITHDLRTITKNFGVELDKNQKSFLKDIGNGFQGNKNNGMVYLIQIHFS